MALPASLQVHPHFQPEEAAHAATELIASLDNLPGEVVFLLEEIREKDSRISLLIQRIHTRHMSLTRTAKQLPNLPASTASFTLPLPPGSSLPTTHLNQKDAQALTKIQAEWVKVEVLQDEKLKLAERMERIVNRAKERAKFEWLKVGGMEIEEVDLKMPTLGEMGGGEVLLPPTGLGGGVDGRPQKKRKPNAIPLPSPSYPIIHPPATTMAPPPAPRPSLSARATHSHGHGHGNRGTNRHSISFVDDPDADGEMDPDGDGEADGEGEADGDEDGVGEADADGEADPTEGTEADDTIYCLCQQKSYGEMIGCDNEQCAYEWFHVKCVNISGPLPDTWYCPDCVDKLGFSSSDGKVAGQNKKGRKKSSARA